MVDPTAMNLCLLRESSMLGFTGSRLAAGFAEPLEIPDDSGKHNLEFGELKGFKICFND